MKLKKTLTALAVASVLMGSTGARAITLDTVTDGLLSDVIGFDWSSLGTAAIYNYQPVADTTFDLVYYSTAASIQQLGGGSFTLPGLNTAYEYTVIANLQEKVLTYNNGTATFQTLGGTFSVYYDTTVNGSYKTGEGITDGTLLFSGVIGDQYGGSFTSFSSTTGLGISTLLAQITYTNNTYLNPDLSDANAISTLAIGGYPFNTSGWLLTDITGSPGVDGASNPFGAENSPNVILQADSSSQLRVIPEPASLALMGISLMGLVGFSRRKSFKK